MIILEHTLAENHGWILDCKSKTTGLHHPMWEWALEDWGIDGGVSVISPTWSDHSIVHSYRLQLHSYCSILYSYIKLDYGCLNIFFNLLNCSIPLVTGLSVIHSIVGALLPSTVIFRKVFPRFNEFHQSLCGYSSVQKYNESIRVFYCANISIMITL